MKKLVLSLLSFTFALSLVAQPVSRDKVVVEIGTGTWCTYCPGAAMGADELITNGCEVAIIENHNGDPYANTASNARNSYYAISGYPTAFFDGVLNYVGGSHTQSMYPNYLPLYQQRIAIPSDFTIDIYGDNVGTTYTVLLVVNKVNGSWGNLKVHLALTESEIVYAWQGMNELNFVNRMMMPDHNGTTFNFTSASTAEIELTFTLESGWVANHCELVAFVQNDVTKECLQGAKVALPDLEPMQATAGFSCNANTPCVNSSVEFEDESGGEIVSWNWTFEGGNPATSTAQNPEVAYNTVGDYDVRLIVYDGEVYDTLLQQDYIFVITNPAQATTPWGANVVCEGTSSVQYHTNQVGWTNTYFWAVEPSAAGTITGSDTNATFTPAQGYIGSYQVKVKAANNCGEGPWSNWYQAEIYNTPEEYTLSDGSGYCDGDPGVEVTLDGSESGVDYELFVDGESTGVVVPGTGSTLSFGLQTEQGIYTCTGYTDYCSRQMVGNTYIYVMQLPATAATPTGSTQECNLNTGVEYATTGATSATSYNWTLSPASAGTITGNTTTAVVDWSDDFTGTAMISVTGVNDCGTGSASQSLQVTVSATPMPEVSGDAMVCDFDLGVIYSTANNPGSTYAWEVTGGTITSGAGTFGIQVDWGAAGNGTVIVTETTAQGCEQASESFAVVIDDCTGIGEQGTTSVNIYPNPAKDMLTIETGILTQDASVMLMNSFGHVVGSQAMKAGSSMVQIDLNSYAAGIYTVKVRLADGTLMTKKFVKSE